MSKPVFRSIVVMATAGVSPGDVPRIVMVLALRVAAPVVVMAIVLAPVAPVPVVTVMPRTVVNGMVPAMMVAALPIIDFMKLPPRQLMIVTQRRAVVPETESPVAPQPAWQVPVAIDTHVVMTRRFVTIVTAIVCRCCLGYAQAEPANDGERAD
jgi:hypothetical protein